MPAMDSVTLENFRCFREKQTVRLAPLTLLVGENSTGKTSFLALLRILDTLQQGAPIVDFKEEPFDLGSFDDIAHFRGGRAGRADSFVVGYQTSSEAFDSPLQSSFEFRSDDGVPSLTRRTYSADDVWIEERIGADNAYSVRMGTNRGTWVVTLQVSTPIRVPVALRLLLLLNDDGEFDLRLDPCDGSPTMDANDQERLRRLAFESRELSRTHDTFASAPVRSRPRRSYEPARFDPDPQGDYIPMYLANLARRDEPAWNSKKEALEDFGRSAGLFDEVQVRLLGKTDGDPFQIQVRKAGKRVKGPFRNLIDVGYGVSQSLPIITELLSDNQAAQVLLQQPEVHLHPSAQAALGSFLCNVADVDRRLVVETHSDHLIDRVRMDVRDVKTKLTSNDVRILYFERNELDVKIHEIWWDEHGNLENVPDGYRRFFMEEVDRSIWPPN